MDDRMDQGDDGINGDRQKPHGNGNGNGSPDETPKKRPLSEISHLFLSSVRDGSFPGLPKPKRKPPKTESEEVIPPSSHDGELDIDLTPEEFAHVFSETDPADAKPKQPPITAVVSAHLNGKQVDRVREYARHLAGQHGRIGLMEIDHSEFRLTCYEPGGPALPGNDPAECFDGRQMAEAIEEMNFDVDRWVMLLPNPRTPEARALLREIDHWVLLSTCDHDGVVSGYRVLKGMVEGRKGGGSGVQPNDLLVTLSLLDGRDDTEMSRVVRKLQGVAHQFLDLELRPEAPVRRSYHIQENLVLFCRPTRDKAQLANPPQWGVVGQFLGRAKGRVIEHPEALEEALKPITSQEIEVPPLAPAVAEEPTIAPVPPAEVQPDVSAPVEPVRLVADVVIPMPQTPDAAPAEPMQSSPPMFSPSLTTAPAMPGQEAMMDEVLELDGPVATPGCILSTMLRRSAGTLVEAPVRPPMCAEARLAVSREHGIMLLAVARQGLAELRSIAQAYRWLEENIALIAMAVPQFAIDARLTPKLRLLVDQSDVSAEVLRPILQSGNVALQAYRMVRWGGRTGLLLDAA
jgi:hypothetical protein